MSSESSSIKPQPQSVTTTSTSAESVSKEGNNNTTTTNNNNNNNKSLSSTSSSSITSATSNLRAVAGGASVNLSDLILSTADTTSSSSIMNQSMTAMGTGGSSGSGGMALNEKVATLASSIYTELEKVIKAHGRDTVKDLMALVVNVLEALDVAYHEKEELSVDNELLKDDYEKLLSQYEREKQHRKDAELKLFQSEDSFAEQKKEYDEKIKSLESIVRMIDLKSKNTSDHVMRLEEKENELKREYNKLHERYTELFKTHCDYMERTKLLFGYDQRLDPSSNHSTLQNNTSNTNTHRAGATNKSGGKSHQQQQQQAVATTTTMATNVSNNQSVSTNLDLNIKQLMDMLKQSPNLAFNKFDLIGALRNQSQKGLIDINSIITVILTSVGSSSASSNGIQLEDAATATTTTATSGNLVPNESTASLTSLVSNNQTPATSTQNKAATQQSIESSAEQTTAQSSENCLGNDAESRLNLQSENFDEHLDNAEFDDNIPDNTNSNKISTDLEAEYEGEYEGLVKNDLSLFNELSKENYDITELDDGADLTGMTREVANLIRENSELLQTKHALNVLKDDLIVRLDQFSNEMVILREEIRSLQTVKACLQLRITELEEEARKAKEELSIKNKKAEEEDETLPISQRKRFTRAEMARVLMERNQYKERLMDLQEAVRWTEMIRATKAAAADQPGGHSSTATATSSGISDEQQGAGSNQHEHHKKRGALWKFFSDLFGSSSQQQQGSNTPQSPQSQQSVLSPKSRRRIYTPGSNMPKSESFESPSKSTAITTASPSKEPQNISKAFEFLKESGAVLPPVGAGTGEASPSSSSSSSSSSNSKLLIDRKKLESVREDGRMQAYGWSLPYKNREGSSASSSSSRDPVLNISVPVPVYCRPLFQKDTMTQLKLSCASTINYLFDGSYVEGGVGGGGGGLTYIAKLHHQLYQPQNQTSCFFESIDAATQMPTFKSSYVWICNFNESDTHVSILDANRPSDLIKQFTLADVKIHCMLSVSGAVRSELEQDAKSEIKLKQHAGSGGAGGNMSDENDLDSITYIEFDSSMSEQAPGGPKAAATTSTSSASSSTGTTITTLYPTMWLGSQEGILLVHSSISDVEVTLERVKLKDAILCMIQNRGKVIVGLADGTAAVFTRNITTGLWDLRNYYLIAFDSSHHSVRCLVNVNQAANIWCGCRNKIYVLNSADLTISTVIEVHPRKENQVRHLAHINDGVWVSIRLDSTLRLYHSKTYQQLQYLDIEPFITRMLGTSNLGLSLIRVSSLIVASKRLWVGTGNGVILSIPFSEETTRANNASIIGGGKKPGGMVRVNSKGEDNSTSSKQTPQQQENNMPIISSRAPYCNISDAQFSFHGHRDSVRFFLNVPNLTIQKSTTTTTSSTTTGSPTATTTSIVSSPVKPTTTTTTTNSPQGHGYAKAETLLVVSGGHGYIDFRIGDMAAIGARKPSNIDGEDIKTLDDESSNALKKLDRAFLIVWQINNE